MARYFYVSAIGAAGRRYIIAGPYPTHNDAKNVVRKTMVLADKYDPRAWFMAWGTAGSDKIITTPLGVV
jgi:hypothetical protein